MKRKTLAALLALSVLLTGCGKNEESTAPKIEENSQLVTEEIPSPVQTTSAVVTTTQTTTTVATTTAEPTDEKSPNAMTLEEYAKASFKTAEGYWSPIVEETMLTGIGGKVTTFDEFIIPEGITAIGAMAFEGLTFENIVFPSTLTTIHRYAFKNCRFGKLTFPEGLTTIGEYAFTESYIESVEFSNTLTTIQDCAFYMCSGFNSVTLPDSLTSLGMGVFTTSACDCQVTYKGVTYNMAISFSDNELSKAVSGR